MEDVILVGLEMLSMDIDLDTYKAAGDADDEGYIWSKTYTLYDSEIIFSPPNRDRVDLYQFSIIPLKELFPVPVFPSQVTK